MFDPKKLSRRDSFIFKFDDGKIGTTPSDRRKAKCKLVIFMTWYSMYLFAAISLIYMATTV